MSDNWLHNEQAKSKRGMEYDENYRLFCNRHNKDKGEQRYKRRILKKNAKTANLKIIKARNLCRKVGRIEFLGCKIQICAYNGIKMQWWRFMKEIEKCLKVLEFYKVNGN
jgi:hypothetical protein